MDSLVGSFSSSFAVSSDPNDTAAPHPRMVQYKEKPSNTPDQATRRKRMLEQQKKKRLDFINYSRKLAEGDLTEEDVYNDNEDMEVMDYKEKRKKFNPYAYQLMLSEWLVDIPEDLEEEWLMVVCPYGRRNLIIASNGRTSAYTKSGFRVNQFSSLLPCGSPNTVRPGEYTILDCIFDELSNTFYVLDVMCWRGHPVFDSETEFRFYWLQTKLQEEERLCEISPSNPYKFEGLRCYPCTAQQIRTVVETPSPFEVDGLLFYHKHTHYNPGRSPLVGWLKVYMLPEILNIPINNELASKAPRINKMTLLKNNAELKDTTDDKTAEERAEIDKHKTSLQAGIMEVEKKERKKKGSPKGRNVKQNMDMESIEAETTPTDLGSKSSARRKRKKNKRAEKMEVMEEGNKKEG